MTMQQERLSVLRVLVQHKAMPFLELTSMLDIDDERLKEIIKQLETEQLVKVSNRGNILKEIVTARGRAFEVAG